MPRPPAKPRPDTPSPPERGSRKETEFTLYGWNACRRAFEQRPQDVVRVFYHKDRERQVADILKWCRTHRLPYRLLDGESLNKVAGGIHHEGLVMVVRPQTPVSTLTLGRKGLSRRAVAVALDAIENPHNVGAILRTCAFFGVEALVAGGGPGPVISSSMARMAEGALESVPLYQSRDLASFLRDMKSKNVFVLGADLTAGASLYDTEIPLPCVAVFGNEQAGLSQRVRQRCDAVVRIPGSPAMQSLNVSVAVGVVLAELRRRHGGPSDAGGE